MVTIGDGMAQTELPLLTFGDKVRYPGLLYNHNGEQFSDMLLAAAQGDETSQTKIWTYVLGGVVLVGGIVALASSGDDDNDDPVVQEETTPQSEDNSPPESEPEGEPKKDNKGDSNGDGGL